MAKLKPRQMKMFIVRKYIMAHSAREALKKDLNTPADDVWVDDDWRKSGADNLASAIGFNISNNNYEED